MNELVLTGIYVYPIKSMGGISLNKSDIENRGFKDDRRWMLVDENGNFISQRTNPELMEFELEIADSGYKVSHSKTGDSIIIKSECKSEKRINVNIWNDNVEAIIVSEKISLWFTKLLNINCNLVYMPDTTIRKVENKPWANEEIVSFADAYPFLLISEESLSDLNNKLDYNINMDRFRPNIVMRGCEPYEEDSWNEIGIGSVLFKVVKPCARCVMITIDQQTGKKDGQILETLSSYRTDNNKVLFGQNLLHVSNGSLSLYDKIEVINRKK